MSMGSSRAAVVSVALLPAVVALLLAGCSREEPIVTSESGGVTNMTLREQRAWVEGETASAISASGVADGWYKSRETIPWSSEREDRDGVLNMLFPSGCGGHSGRLNLMLQNRAAEDPLKVAARVRAHWESAGWRVTNIRSYEADPYFRADRDDGAELAFQASETGMWVEVSSACSSHSTVRNWQYDDPDTGERVEDAPDAAAID